MSEYPRCWIDADGCRVVYTSRDSIFCQSFNKDDLRFAAGLRTTIDERSDLQGGREYSHEEFLRICDGEPIAEKLRELLAEKPLRDAVEAVKDCVSAKQPETLAERRERLEREIKERQAELNSLECYHLGTFIAEARDNGFVRIMSNTLGRGDQQALVNWLATHGIKETT